MKKKHMIITAAVLLVVIAGGITAYSLLSRGTQDTEEEDFLPEGWEIDIGKLRDTTLTFYINAMSQSEYKDVLEELNLKLDNDIRCKIAFEFYYENYQAFINRIKRDNASGQTCDAFFYSPDSNMSVKSIADEGLAMDVSGLFPEYASGYYNQFTNEEIKAMSVSGGIYLIPPRIPSTSVRYALVRQDLMEKYRIPEIHSYDDLEAYLERIRLNEPDMLPLRLEDTTMGLFADVYGYVILDYVSGLVYKWDDPSMKVMAWEQVPEYKEILERIRRWNDNDYLGTDGRIDYVLVDENPEAAFSAPFITDGKTASFISDPSDQMYFNTLLSSKGIRDFTYKAYPLYDGYSARYSIPNKGIMINSRSRQPERVLMFIDWLQSYQENYDLLMYGAKGTHYVDKGDYIEPPAGTATTFLVWGWKMPFENIDNQRANYPGQSSEMAEYREILDKKTKYPPHFGFRPDFSTMKRLYEDRYMSLLTQEHEIFNDHDFDDTMYEEFLEEQKSHGIDILIGEVQGQLDGYMAGNAR